MPWAVILLPVNLQDKDGRGMEAEKGAGQESVCAGLSREKYARYPSLHISLASLGSP